MDETRYKITIIGISSQIIELSAHLKESCIGLANAISQFLDFDTASSEYGELARASYDRFADIFDYISTTTYGLEEEVKAEATPPGYESCRDGFLKVLAALWGGAQEAIRALDLVKEGKPMEALEVIKAVGLFLMEVRNG